MLLHEKLIDKRIILASKSPRRRELISGTGLKFDLAADYDVEEIYPEWLEPELVPEYLAKLKSDSYPVPLEQNDILITADTVVLHDGCVLGKPADRKEAIVMLGKLSGSVHRVVTGVSIRNSDRLVVFSAKTDVWFRSLTTQEIEFYVDTYQPYDKAGAYGIQEWIGYVAIERIEGSFYNVMGLPVQLLYVNLEQFA